MSSKISNFFVLTEHAQHEIPEGVVCRKYTKNTRLGSYKKPQRLLSQFGFQWPINISQTSLSLTSSCCVKVVFEGRSAKVVELRSCLVELKVRSHSPHFRQVLVRRSEAKANCAKIHTFAETILERLPKMSTWRGCGQLLGGHPKQGGLSEEMAIPDTKRSNSHINKFLNCAFCVRVSLSHAICSKNNKSEVHILLKSKNEHNCIELFLKWWKVLMISSYTCFVSFLLEFFLLSQKSTPEIRYWLVEFAKNSHHNSALDNLNGNQRAQVELGVGKVLALEVLLQNLGAFAENLEQTWI